MTEEVVLPLVLAVLFALGLVCLGTAARVNGHQRGLATRLYGLGVILLCITAGGCLLVYTQLP
jgi:hypothetical protein